MFTLGLFASSGCTEGGAGLGDPDSGVAVEPDASTGYDAKPIEDAALEDPNPDAAVEVDAGLETDAGLEADAATPDAEPADADAPDAEAPDAGAPDDAGVADGGAPAGQIQTVFLIIMENHNWSDISGNTTDAPYINDTLLPMSAHAEGYTGNAHPSEPNYVWLVAGRRLGIYTDSAPATNHQATHEHLAYLLDQAGVTWREYAEDITGTECPLTDIGGYRPKHNPFVFFDDLTGSNDPNDADCIAHNRPYSELAGDLQQNSVARFNFLTPNLCNDMHDDCDTNGLQQGDLWLSENIPMIMSSPAYQNNGVIIITWDESEFSLTHCPLANCSIGMIVISPLAKVAYSNSTSYDHSSTLKSLQEIFGVTPLLGAAADTGTSDLSDLFLTFP